MDTTNQDARSARLAADAPLRFDALIDQSRLRYYPLKLASLGSVQLAGPDGSTVVLLDSLQLASGRTELSLTGQATPPFALRGRLNSPNLAALLPENIAVQGNLDPSLLATTPEAVAAETKRILDDMRDRPGHIFNLGHGVTPESRLECIQALVDTVRS